MPTFEGLKAEYARLWVSMEIRPDRISAVDKIAHKLLVNKPTYLAAQTKTGVPWFVIAAWHNRESGADFSTQLAQGDPLDQVSRNEPSGRGPFSSWQDGAYDALVTLKHLDTIREWTPERICYETERYNGFGHRNKGINAPYLWSFTNHYTKGKYVKDHVYDPEFVDKQCGAIPIIKRIMELDGIKTKKPVDTGVIIAAGGGAVATAAAGAGGNPWVIGFIIAAVVITFGLFIYYRRKNG